MRIHRPSFSDLDSGALGSIGRDLVVEPKYDGMWGTLDAARGAVWSRHGKFKATIGRRRLSGVVVVGEWLASSQWAHAAGLDRTFVAFDLLKDAGRCVRAEPLHERRRRLAPIARALGLALAPQAPASRAGAWWGEWVERRGYEGLVIKDPSAQWGGPWARVKQVHTAEYVCLGPVAARCGTRAGSLRAGLVRGGAVVQVGTVGGLSAADAAAVWARPDHYHGQVFEARGRSRLSAGGVMRHPTFSRWRPDYPADHCVIP